MNPIHTGKARLLASIIFSTKIFSPPVSFWSYRFHALCVLWGLVQEIFFLILTWGSLWPGPSPQAPVSAGMSHWCERALLSVMTGDPGLSLTVLVLHLKHPLPWGARVPLTGKWYLEATVWVQRVLRGCQCFQWTEVGNIVRKWKKNEVTAFSNSMKNYRVYIGQLLYIFLLCSLSWFLINEINII